MKSDSCSNPVFMVLIDALADTYISRDHTPFLHSFLEKGKYSTIEPMFAYRGIEATIFTGFKPNSHKVWTEYCLNEPEKENIKSYIINESIILCDKIPASIFNRVLRYVFKKSMIPSSMIKYFKNSQLAITDPNVLPFPTLFDVLRNNNRSFYFLIPSASKKDKEIFKITYKSLETENHDFWFIKFGMLDSFGHLYGPNPEKLKNILKDIDGYIQNLYIKFKQKYTCGTFLIVSDHGMNEVKSVVNPNDFFNDLNFIIPKDYLYFVDSTMLRLWFFNETAKSRIIERLLNVNAGTILRDNELKFLGIDKVGHKYGEVIFALKEKYVFSPDFFRSNNPPNGMHGYYFETSKPILIFIHSTNIKKNRKVQFSDLMPTILELLNLDSPLIYEGTSLLYE